MNDVLNSQQEHWEDTFAEKPEIFGASPSEPAKAAMELFKRERAKMILELGSRQGRDTMFSPGADSGLSPWITPRLPSGRSRKRRKKPGFPPRSNPPATISAAPGECFF